MKRISIISFWLALLLLGNLARGQQSINTVKYRVSYDASTQTYTAFLVPDYVVPNSFNSLSTEKGATAQFTVVVPSSFLITEVVDIRGTWTKASDLLKLGPGQPGQTWGAYNLNPGLNYYTIGKAATETDYGSFQSGQPVALFTFKGNGCFGPIMPLMPNDPFINAADQEYALNVANSFSSRSGQPSGGNQQPLEQFVNITGAAANCAPGLILTANPDNTTTLAGTPATTNVLANDTNTGQPASTSNVTVSITTQPPVGTVVVNANGTITYTAPANFTGTACYSYQICDLVSTTACSAPAQVCVTVQAVVPPKVLTANPDNTTTLAGTPATTNVLANDTNTGQPASISNVTVSITAQPPVGTVVVNANGTITYTAPANFTGTACYSYQICDLTSTTACSAPAQVCVTVQAVVPPKVLTANPDNTTTLAGTPATTNVLANDTNTGQPASTSNVTVSITTQPPVGTVVVNPDGTITYTAPANFTGTACYSYQICDLVSTTACSAPAQVCVAVQAVVPPKVLTANPDNTTTLAGTPATTNVLANDINTGQPASISNVTVSITAQPPVGTVVVNANGTITYTAPANFTGTACYSYQICDLTSTTACSAPAQVCVTVQAVVPPKVLTANPDNTTTLAGTPATTNVLANDTNTGQPASTSNVTVSITTQPPVGTVVVNADGTITYTAPANFTGTACYSYQICDLTSTTACSAPAQVCVTVQALVVLVANPNSATTAAGTPSTISVLANDTNTGQPASISNVTVSITTQPATGTVVVNANGTITYFPPANFAGVVCYNYQICDLTSTTACSASAQVCVTVQAVVPPKVLTANPDNATVTAGTPTIINVLANDTNTGQPASSTNATVSITTQPVTGTAVVNADGTISFTPPANFTGTVCYAYQICDLSSTTACSASAQVCVTITPKPIGNADVSVTKRVVGSKLRALGDVVAFEIIVKNLGPDPATNVVVKDSLANGLQFQSASVTTGTGTYTNPLFIIPTLASGDSTVLTVLAKVVLDGISFNYARVVSQDQIDPNPANNSDQICASVPVNLCTGEAIIASVPATFTNVQWFKAGLVVATGNTVTLIDGGTYTFTASNSTCPAEGCCPLVIVQSDCCPVNACVPFVITKTRRK